MKITVTDGSKTPEGYYVGRARVTGESVLDYTNVYGVHIYRPLAEITKPESTASLKLLPITFSHPDGNIDSETAGEVTIGWTGEDVTLEESTGALIVNFKIIEKWAVDLIDQAIAAGQRVQFSVGADAKPVFEPGVFRGQAYQVWLRDIVYNHLALLIGKKGRYPTTQIITDSKAATQPWLILWDAQVLPVDSKNNGGKTVKVKLTSGFEVEIADAEAPQVIAEVKAHDELKTQFADQKAQLAQAKKDLTANNAKLLDSKGVATLLEKRKELAVEAAQFLDSVEPIDLMVMDEAGIYEAVLLENGHSQDELNAEKAELKDSYPVYLKSAYRAVKKANPASESDDVLEVADSTSKTKSPASDPHVVILDTAAGSKALRDRMDKRAKGEIV